VQDSDGSKMVNEYVRKHNLGTGSYGKVVSQYKLCDDTEAKNLTTV
jgi:sulfatase maturation enzyme AslB (radical SAM superfamily)